MTEQAQAPQPPEDPINAVLLDLKLPVAIVNQILLTLAKLPYEEAAETILMIRQQGDSQVMAARTALSAPAAPANTNRKARRAAGAKKR